MTHLSTRDLLAWRDRPSDADRGRVVAHLALCDRCAASYAELIRTRPLEGPPPARALEDFLARGHAVGAGARRAAPPGTLTWHLARVAPLAAAAALVAAIVLPLGQRTDELPVVRGDTARVTLVGPAGPGVDRDRLVFEWVVPPDADRLRLQVFDMAAPGQALLQREVAGGRYEPSGAERAALPTGRDLYWFLEYRTGQSATLVSPAAKFSVR